MARHGEPDHVSSPHKPGSDTVAVAYLAAQYPRTSQSFIRREVQALRTLGMHVETFAIRAADPADLLSSSDRGEAATTMAIRPTTLSQIARVHVKAAFRHPRAYLATLARGWRAAPPIRRGRLYQCFYFAEAIVLWDGMRRRALRHVHAHFANVACDVARLTVAFGTAAGREPWSWSFTMHGPTEFFAVERFGLVSKIEQASLVVCISEFCRSQLMVLVAPEHWGKLEVVHCGLDPAEFVPCPSSDRPDPFRVLCVGRLVPEKGQAILIEAIAELCHRGLPIRLTVVGDGPSRQALEALATQRGLDGQVTFTGALGEEEVIARYQDSDALCVPSFAEGLPVVLMEAMALGLPVVTTRISGIAELVEDGTSGFVVPPGRIDLMADALSRLATDPRHRLEMGRAGRAAVAAGYDIASSAQALYGLLRQCPGAVSPASSDQTRLAGQA